MRKIFLIAATAGLAVAGTAMQGQCSPIIANGAGANLGVLSQIKPIKAESGLYDYCKKVIDDVQHGTSSGSSGDFVASDCIGIFIEAAIASGLTFGRLGKLGQDGTEGVAGGMPGGRGGAAGQPGEDGQGFPGLPGGKGGAGGGAGAESSAEAAVEEELLDYCDAVLKQSRRGSAAKAPLESDNYELSDCVDYFASFAPSGKSAAGDAGAPKIEGARPGSDGPSISGGRGGKGGAPGSGPGGAGGGAGGPGVGGGSGGKGGAGGSGY